MSPKTDSTTVVPNAVPKLAVLVSVGQHPKSGRTRRADQDARAVELGMRMSDQQGLRLIHAGDKQEPALRQYLGMGLKSMVVLNQQQDSDVVPALVKHFNSTATDIILTGVKAETGEASGMVPYLLAEQLGWPIIPRIADIIRIDGQEAEVLQALPRGQRRALKVRLPFIASVDNAATAARQYAFGPGQRGDLYGANAENTPDKTRVEWSESPARKRAKRLNIVKAKSASDRFKAATAKPQGSGGQVLKDETAKEKAQAILDLMLAEGVIR